MPSSVVSMVYGNTTDGSPLRSMIVHTYELIEGPYLAAAMLDDSTTLPQSFLADLVEGLITTSPRIRSSEKEYEKIDMCPLFHVHEESVSCTENGIKRSADELDT
jgi:hypothetical protein